MNEVNKGRKERGQLDVLPSLSLTSSSSASKIYIGSTYSSGSSSPSSDMEEDLPMAERRNRENGGEWEAKASLDVFVSMSSTQLHPPNHTSEKDS